MLTLTNISKSFAEQVILDQLSLTITEGEVVVILGPSGCGKSTLLRCINGLEKIDSGAIRLDNQAISYDTRSLHHLRQKIGMVFQSYDLFPHLSVLDNLILGPTKVQKRPKKDAISEAIALLDRVGLADKKDQFPRELSGGQKQRVAIVRALLMNPEIILFDEVTASLDPEMVREVLELISGLAKEGRTMLLVTHELAFAKAIADRIIFIDKGKIIEETPATVFFNQPQTKRAQVFLEMFDFSQLH